MFFSHCQKWSLPFALTPSIARLSFKSQSDIISLIGSVCVKRRCGDGMFTRYTDRLICQRRFYQQSSTSFRHVLDGQASDFVCSLMEQLRCYTAGCYHFLTDQHTRAMTSTGCNLFGCQTHRCYYCSQRHTHAHESSCTFTIHCLRHNLISGTRNRWKNQN